MRRAWILMTSLIVSIAWSGLVRPEVEPQPKPEPDHENADAQVATSKSLTLEISLSGLVALVREGCAAHPTNPQSLHILMMKGGTGGMKHQPRLVVESKYAGPTNEPSEIIELGDGKQYFIWDLTGYRLELDQAPPRIGVVEGTRTPNARTPANDKDDISWVPELHRACGVAADTLKIKKNAFDATLLPSYAVARLMDLQLVKFPNASISPSDTNVLWAVHDEFWDNKPFDFPGKSYQQSLADRVSLKMNLQYTNFLTLKLVPLVASLPPREVHVRPPQLKNDVVVSVTNLPTMQEAPSDNVDHFRYFFDLAHDSTATCVIPTRGGMGAAPVKCTLCSTCGPGLGP